jgi:hypothetical protein
MDRARLISLLDQPEALEALHRDNPAAFRAALPAALAERPDDLVLRAWQARLAGPARAGSGVTPGGAHWGAALLLALATGLAARLTALGGDPEWAYPRFAPALALLAPALWLAREARDRRALAVAVVVAALSALWAGVLPGGGDSVLMALLHLPVLGWAALGLAHAGSAWRETESRLGFLRCNGELLILGSLLALGGGVFSALSLALFSQLAPGVDEWYAKNVGVAAAAALPLAATVLYDKVFRRRTGIPAVLARVFSPLFLLMTVAYLGAALAAGHNPFTHREPLIVLNGLLLVVLGMTVLSVAEQAEDAPRGPQDAVHTGLLGATLLLDLLALSSILFRLSEYGLTPNRVVVLGANLAILGHMAWLAWTSLGVLRGSSGRPALRRAVAGWLPVYVAWAALVALALPWLFRFR